jgi:hypothetical protein
MYTKMSLVVVALVSMTAPVRANTTRFFSATDCTGNTSVDNSILARFKEGCFNYYQGPAVYDDDTQSCGPRVIAVLPIIGNNNDTVDFDTIVVNYTNGSVLENISCTIFVQNSAGTVYASSSLNSALAPSGTVPVIGALTWTGASLPNGGSSISNVQTQTIFCTIPSKFMGLDGSCFLAGFSHITNYVVDTAQP